MESFTVPSPAKRGKSILRRSSIALQRRLSRDESTTTPCNITSVRRSSISASLNYLSGSAQLRGPCMGASRRNSIATLKRSQEFQGPLFLTQSLGSIRRNLPSLKEDEEQQAWPQHQHDYKDFSTYENNDEYQDIDTCSICSDNTDMCEIDFAGDPNDWFLEEDADDDNEPSFVVLEKEELEERQTNIIESVGMQLNIPPADAALVLQYFNWDTDNLLGTYFDNPEFYLYKAGLVSPHNPFPLSTSTNRTMTCPVCLEETPRTDMFTLGCSHSYCLDCWRRYLHEITESSGPEIVNASCIDPKCIVKLNFLDFERLACTEDYNRYHYFFLKRFAESDPHIVYCPNPSCGNAVLYQGDGHPTDVVECHCGTRFCFSCGLEKHNPVTCEQLKMWLDLLRDDSESMSVIKSTSKQCFHCGVPTERITGCNHMVCRKEMGGCGGEWCWMCRGDWKTHGAHTGGFYSCNKYENSDAKKIDEDSQSYLQSSQRLMHYFNRYFNHDVLMKNMQKQLSDGGVEQKMDHFMGITSCCPDFYMEAAELLVECRRMLKYTYVYGYYLEEGPGRALFEYQQASAEGVTERLSDMFHSSVENIAQSPLEFVNYIRVAKKHINNLIKSIEAGFTLESVQSFEN